MYLSKYNIISKLQDSEEYFILNILTGNADILSSEKALEIINNSCTDGDLIEKGYLIDEKEEKRLFNAKYLDFIDNRDKDEIQIFFVPWYSCNFSCSYCYQSGYENEHQLLPHEVIDAFFSYINKEFSNRRKYITLFGGEPLLSGKSQKEVIKYFLDKSAINNIDVAIVTNGYTLSDYIETLKEYKIREIQVTLDGINGIHNSRRALKNGDPTFNKITEGIDLALKNSINVNLRSVLDKENMDGLIELAHYSIEKGWTINKYFKTQLGRNYELHYCQSDQSRLFTRIEFYQTIYNLVKKHPEFMEFHKPAFSISKFLFENGELPFPLFDACTGCKTEWAFDYTGRIYSCTATVGKEDRALGTFYPSVNIETEKIEFWEDRDITSIDQCRSCSLALACGAGCAEIAFNKNGDINSPDCRPIKELLEMGISLYYNQENQ